MRLTAGVPPSERPKLVRWITAFTLGVWLGLTPVPCLADLQRLGDAMADVVTFGAWGQSRDLANAEIARLQLRFQEERKRAENKAGALVATTRIEEKARFAIETRQVGQRLLKIIAAIDVLLAQHKQLIVDRFEIDKNVTRFAEWFDKFVAQVDDKLASLTELVRATATGDERAIGEALEAARLARMQNKSDAEKAKKYLKAILSAARSDTIAQAMGQLVAVRADLANLLEDQRDRLRSLVDEMAAEDTARRTLCDPRVVGVSCDDRGSSCRYYSPDPREPLPCGDLVYFNAFPVSAIKAIYDNLDAYARNADFFVRLEELGTVRPISVKAFRSPGEVFGADLAAAKLLPAEFVIPQGCGDISNYGVRLLQAFDVMVIFGAAEDRSVAARAVVAQLAGWRPLAEFWLDGLARSLPAGTNCNALPSGIRGKLRRLVRAITALETFGDALANGDSAFTDDPKSLEPVRQLVLDF